MKLAPRRSLLWSRNLLFAALSLAPLGAGAQPAKRLNDIQVLGSHNSYRRVPPPAILAAMEAVRPGAAAAFDYDHPSLARQLDLGLRQLELDVFADPDGGRFADPIGERILARAGLASDFDAQAMRVPGFKAMHIPGLDYGANCLTLVACLTQVRDWSDAHPGHLPIFITIDSKDKPFTAYPGAIAPLPLTTGLLDALDAEIRAVLPGDRLITPDHVRGRHATLREAATAAGWPTLQAARGKVMVIFDVRKETADLYRQGHPSLAGRAMFSLYDPSEPEAAVAIVQNPRDKTSEIAGLVRQGFIVRTRSDADMKEAWTGDRSGMVAAATSGAQMISTDYYTGGPNALSGGFALNLPGDTTARCNPVRQPAACRLESGQPVR